MPARIFAKVSPFHVCVKILNEAGDELSLSFGTTGVTNPNDELTRCEMAIYPIGASGPSEAAGFPAPEEVLSALAHVLGFEVTPKGGTFRLLDKDVSHESVLAQCETPEESTELDIPGLCAHLTEKFGTRGREFLFDGTTLKVRYYKGFAIFSTTSSAVKEEIDTWVRARGVTPGDLPE